MKKHIFFAFVFAVFCMAGTFAETKINVKQSIRYGNGDFVAMDTPQIFRKKAHKEGGMVYLRYDFEVTQKGFGDDSDIYIFIRVPSEYMDFTEESCMKVTTLSGATDVRLEVLRRLESFDEIFGETKYYSGVRDSKYYSRLRDSIGRLPKAELWIIQQQIEEKKGKDSYSYEVDKDFFIGIPLKMQNKKGNTANIEFYIDFNALEQFYNDAKRLGGSTYIPGDMKYVNWLEKIIYNEIPIDISFHSAYGCNVGFDVEYFDEYGCNRFLIQSPVGSFNTWKYAFSSSNKAYTLLVKE